MRWKTAAFTLRVTPYALRAFWCLLLIAGCATPEYAVRATPVPEESAEAIRIERAISAVQAEGFEEQGARRLGAWERPGGLAVQQVVDRLSRVTERPSLPYRAYLYADRDPNAAALADGRIYVSTGMTAYLAGRGSREDEPFDSASPRASTALGIPSERSESRDSGRMPSAVEAELAFIVAHELAHTVAQHLVKRYRMLQQQQLLMALVAVGAAATRDAGAGAQQAGHLALDAASLLQDIHNSGYSQEQELEADQLGIRYVIRAGYNPQVALELLADFARFDAPAPFLRTHPYITERRAHLQRYLLETGHLRGGGSAPAEGMTPLRGASGAGEDRLNPVPRKPRLFPRRGADPEGFFPDATGANPWDGVKQLREVQRLYPEGSVSWKNLQREIERLERGR